MPPELKKRVEYCLFACRISVFLVFMAWTLDKLIRPSHGVGIMQNFYLIPGLSEVLIFLFGLFELGMCLLFVTGYYKRITRGFFLFLSLMSIVTPRALNGLKNGILEGWHTNLYFFAFSLLAASMFVYVLRDFDTRFSLADRPREPTQPRN